MGKNKTQRQIIFPKTGADTLKTDKQADLLTKDRHANDRQKHTNHREKKKKNEDIRNPD